MFALSTTDTTTPGDVKSVLSCHFSRLSLSADVDEANYVFVRRKHVWKDTVRAFSKPSFDCHKSLSVIFVGEEAMDVGGPKREFST